MLSGKVIPRVAIVSAAELLPTIRLQRVATVSLEHGVSLGSNKELKSRAPVEWGTEPGREGWVRGTESCTRHT